MFAPGSSVDGLYLTTIATFGEYMSAPYKSRKRFKHAQSRWYCAGELHRDYGPAVTGTTRSFDGVNMGTSAWWHKYDRGKQMATDSNTFMDELAELCPRMRAYCVCGCVRLVASGPITYYAPGNAPGDRKLARVYQTCTGKIIETVAIQEYSGSINRVISDYYQIGVVDSPCRYSTGPYETVYCLSKLE